MTTNPEVKGKETEKVKEREKETASAPAVKEHDEQMPKPRMSNLERQIYNEVSHLYGQWLDVLVKLYGRRAYGVVRSLEKKGFVVRVSDPENPRRIIIMTHEVKERWDKGE